MSIVKGLVGDHKADQATSLDERPSGIPHDCAGAAFAAERRFDLDELL
jgi:hypothetical protein